MQAEAIDDPIAEDPTERLSLDAMGGEHARVERLPAEPAAQLGFARPAVAEEQDLDLRVDPLAGLKVLVVGTDFIQDVLKPVFPADFRWQII